MTDENRVDAEKVAEAIENSLNDSESPMLEAGYAVRALADLGEVYVRAPDGSHWRMTVQPVSAEDVESWGIDFDEA